MGSRGFLNRSSSLDIPLSEKLEELAMERHRLALIKGGVDVYQWRGHSVG